MNQKLVAKTGLIKRAANGVIVTKYMDGEGVDVFEESLKIEHLPIPMKTLASQMWLESGEVVKLPYNEYTDIIPDRTGVLMIFSDNSEGLKEFPKPNNAAIYNADGSLRFQLKAPKGWPIDRIHGVHVSKISSGKYAGMMEVLIATSSLHQPDCAWILNPNQPELIPTYQDVRY